VCHPGAEIAGEARYARDASDQPQGITVQVTAGRDDGERWLRAKQRICVSRRSSAAVIRLVSCITSYGAPAVAEKPTPTEERNLPPILENIFAPEIFASEATVFYRSPGTITVTFTSYRFDNSTHPGSQKRVVIGRLVMPISGAQGLAAGLYDYLKKQGLDPAPHPTDPLQVQ